MSNIKAIRNLFRMTGGVRSFIILTLLRSPFDALHAVIQASFLQFAFEAINKESLKGFFHVTLLFGIGSLFLFLYNGFAEALYGMLLLLDLSSYKVLRWSILKTFFHIALQ